MFTRGLARRRMLLGLAAAAGAGLAPARMVAAVPAVPADWRREWPATDFSRTAVDFDEISGGGPPRDGIPALDVPRFGSVTRPGAAGPEEPVIVVAGESGARGYPLRILMWHEIVNDEFEGRPIAVTYCPLCNASVAFDREISAGAGHRTLSFGVSGKLRHSDMIMFDRQTQSWWQQFTGRAIIGELLGTQLVKRRSQVLPFKAFAARHPGAEVLLPPTASQRRYGINPYVRYDGGTWPFLYRGQYRGSVPPLTYVVAVGKQAWPLSLLRERGSLRAGALELQWRAGMNSALDAARIGEGRDIGYVEVWQVHDGKREVVPHDVTFAFAFKAFHPDGVLVSH